MAKSKNSRRRWGKFEKHERVNLNLSSSSNFKLQKPLLRKGRYFLNTNIFFDDVFRQLWTQKILILFAQIFYSFYSNSKWYKLFIKDKIPNFEDFEKEFLVYGKNQYFNENHAALQKCRLEFNQKNLIKGLFNFYMEKRTTPGLIILNSLNYKFKKFSMEQFNEFINDLFACFKVKLRFFIKSLVKNLIDLYWGKSYKLKFIIPSLRFIYSTKKLPFQSSILTYSFLDGLLYGLKRGFSSFMFYYSAFLSRGVPPLDAGTHSFFNLVYYCPIVFKKSWQLRFFELSKYFKKQLELKDFWKARKNFLKNFFFKSFFRRFSFFSRFYMFRKICITLILNTKNFGLNFFEPMQKFLSPFFFGTFVYGNRFVKIFFFLLGFIRIFIIGFFFIFWFFSFLDRLMRFFMSFLYFLWIRVVFYFCIFFYEFKTCGKLAFLGLRYFYSNLNFFFSEFRFFQWFFFGSFYKLLDSYIFKRYRIFLLKMRLFKVNLKRVSFQRQFFLRRVIFF